jgi:hypothetical protein
MNIPKKKSVMNFLGYQFTKEKEVEVEEPKDEEDDTPQEY